MQEIVCNLSKNDNIESLTSINYDININLTLKCSYKGLQLSTWPENHKPVTKIHTNKNTQAAIKWISLLVTLSSEPCFSYVVALSGPVWLGHRTPGTEEIRRGSVEWEIRTALSEAWHRLLWTGKDVKRMVRWGLRGKNVGRPRLWHLLWHVKTWLVELVLTVVQITAKETHVMHYIQWQYITKSFFRGQYVQNVCILSSEFIYQGQRTVHDCPRIKSSQIYLYSAFDNKTHLQVSYRKLES